MKKVYFVMLLALVLVPVFGQSGTTTVNNTITINGNVYYFKPSTSPSSPLPRVSNSSNWIGDGEWWGQDAARAWASIVDWTVLHCTSKWTEIEYSTYRDKFDPDKYTTGGYNVYINRITAQRSERFNREAEIKIYYWVVDKGKRMETGKPAFVSWNVEF
ncbi:MAG: hypothetical protein LBD48_09835 [Treponema sp.]|jgi:hypothetical protein|nr:hypothetical protein [Treponema sp.]